MKISSDNWEDVNKYFNGTYVKFREEGELVYKIIKVNSEELIAQDMNGNKVKVDLSKEYDLDYILPKKTVYQQGEFAYILTRIPKRMWSKGVCDQNTAIMRLYMGEWGGIPVSIDNFVSFVGKNTFYTFDAAVSNFKGGGSLQSAALSNRVSMDRSGSIYVDTVRIGTYHYEQKNLMLKKAFISAISHLFTCEVVPV